MENYSWIKTYNTIGRKILEYSPRELAELMYKMFEEANIDINNTKSSALDCDEEKNRIKYKEIDPISFMNRFDVYGREKTNKLIEAFKRITNTTIDIPNDYSGIPKVNPYSSSVIAFSYERGKNDIKDIYELFEYAINEKEILDNNKFVFLYDRVVNKKHSNNNISIGLFKIRPDLFIGLDNTNRNYLKKVVGIKLKSKVFGNEYLELIKKVKVFMKENNINNYAELSDNAWEYLNKEKRDNSSSNRTWLYAPGEGAKLWDECYNNNLMLIGWDKVGDIEKLKSKKEINNLLKEKYDVDSSMRNDTNTLYQFLKDVKIGDIVIVKKGNHVLLGYGKVTSDYYYIENREEYQKARNVEWIKKGVWDISDKGIRNLNIKTLTDLTTYGDYSEKLLKIMDGEEIMEKENTSRRYYWLNANPKNWSFDKIKVGECIDYTSTNENGNKRRIYRNFLEIQKGDMIIGYEATPKKKIVALCEAQDKVNNEKFWVKKIENLINPIPLSEVKDLEYFSKSEFLMNPQGSLFKLTENEYNELMDVIRDSNPKEISSNKEKYTEEDFKTDVLMKRDNDLFNDLKDILERKKNIILQGAPGVGKTYIAKRLAWALTGEKDSNKIKFVQFHQSYGYEDFITGYKPNDNGGFDKEDGIFYDFCKMAENDTDPDSKYIFIIDEINRGNLSKIFGEVLMLIEADKRGQQINLAYKKDEKFSVPENVYIIGMMNTADRSVSTIDYALRRRFAFYTIEPLYGTDELKEYLEHYNNKKLNQIEEIIENINNDIRNDESLGEEFEVGHSYFCNLKDLDDKKLKMIVEYEILPLLKEYYFDNTEKYKNYKNKLLGVFDD